MGWRAASTARSTPAVIGSTAAVTRRSATAGGRASGVTEVCGLQGLQNYRYFKMQIQIPIPAEYDDTDTDTDINAAWRRSYSIENSVTFYYPANPLDLCG